MNKLIQICFILCFISSAVAQDDRQAPLNPQNDLKVLGVYEWKDLTSRHPFPNSEIVSMDGVSVLKVQTTNYTHLEFSLLEITNSSTIKKLSSLYCEVEAKGFPESWLQNGPYSGLISPGLFSTFQCLSVVPSSVPGGDRTTNRLYYPIGSSNWKAFNFAGVVLANENLPETVEIKLDLNWPGTVYLRPIKLFEYRGSSNWWSPQQSGLIGGIGGSAIGCLGALIGILAGRGKARRFVLAAVTISIVAGILLVIAGVIAVAMKQPYAVWYPLLLGGAILAFVFGINLHSIKRRYEEQEIRRMVSLDATGHS